MSSSSRLIVHADARHKKPDLFPGCIATRENRADLTVKHDSNAIRKGHDLIQFIADQQHGDALIPFGDDLAVDKFDRADIDSTRRLRRHQ